MVEYKEVYGDLITLAKQGEFDVIAHGANCFCNMGAGIAPQMAKAFGCDKFTFEGKEYMGDYNKLGQIDFEIMYIDPQKSCVATTTDMLNGATVKPLTVVNCYSQFRYGKNHIDGVVKPLDYDALRLCLRKINFLFKGKHIGLPQIGCGLAGGSWELVSKMIKEELKDCKITIVIYKK